MSETQEKARTVMELLERMTPIKLLMGIVTGIAGITLWSLWEHRTSVFAAIAASPGGIASLAAGVALLLVAAVAYGLVSAMDAKTGQTLAAMQDRIDELHRMLREEKEQCAHRLKEVSDSCEMRISELWKLINARGGD